jgi:hemin uptake protein HemP
MGDLNKKHITNPEPSGQNTSARSRVSSEALLNGRKELVIEHAGDEYRLRLTSQGKLILTK